MTLPPGGWGDPAGSPTAAPGELRYPYGAPLAQPPPLPGELVDPGPSDRQSPTEARPPRRIRVRVGWWRRARSAMALVVVAVLLSAVLAALLSAVVAGLSIAVHHASRG